MINHPLPFLNSASYQAFVERTTPATPQRIDDWLAQTDFMAINTPKSLLDNLMRFETEMLWLKQYDMVGYMLDNFPFERANALATISVLRSACSHKHHFESSFATGLQQARQRLVQLGRDDPDRDLRGLSD